MTINLGIATLGGGCFWCLEAAFAQVRGVAEAVSGYSGGHVARPRYGEVCSGTTGHAEVVRLRFDPAVVSYRALLEIFFALHDPTTLNRQGNDVGTQYRSVIFYHSPAQRAEAEQLMAELAGAYPASLVTELTEAGPFYPAEDYHQGYFAAHGHEPYCRLVVAPKVAKLAAAFPERLK